MLGAHRNEQIESVGQNLSSGTTQFNTDSIVQHAVAAARIPANGLMPISDQTIPDFLAKPQVVTTFPWSTSNTVMTTLSTNGIGPSLTAYQPWFEKFRGFENVRGTACFRLTINTNPFQQGKLIMSFLPVQSTSNPTLVTNSVARYGCRNAVTQLPNVELDCRDGVAVIKIPYVSPYDYYNLKKDLFDWGTLKINVLSALRTGSGGSTSVNCTLFQWFEDFEMATPLYPQMAFEPQMGGKSSSKKVKTMKGVQAVESEGMARGTVTRALGLVSNVADLVADTVPSLAPISTTVSWVSNALSGIASFFGWSKPDLDTPPLFVVPRNAHSMANMDGVSTAPSLALLHNNSVGCSSTMFGTDSDEMSFAFLKKHESFFYAGTWATNQATDVSLWNFAVVPANFVENWNLVRGAYTFTFQSCSPMAFLARNFGYYRGSINVHFKVVKTEFHTGRLLFTYTPTMGFTASPSNANSTLSLREIIDLRGNSEFTITLPYLFPQKYSKISDAMGNFNVRVLNELECPETCSSTVDFLVYVTAGDDFEFQAPGGTTAAFPENVFSPQMGDIVAPDHSSNVVQDVVGDQKIPLNSLDCAAECFGESFSSIKQLINRYTPLRSSSKIVSASTGDAAGLVTMYPFAMKVGTNDSSGNLITPTFFGDALSTFASGYAFYRGSVRISLYNKDIPNAVVLTYLKISRDASGGYLTLNDTLPPGFFSASTMALTGGSNYNVTAFQLHNSHTGVVEVKVPYYNVVHMTPIDAGGYGLSAPAYSVNPSNPDASLSFQIPASTSPTQIFRSASDEFQFGYFIGFAPILIARI